MKSYVDFDLYEALLYTEKIIINAYKYRRGE